LTSSARNFVAGSVKKNHWFWVDESSPTVMNTQSHHNNEDAERTMYNHMIRMQGRLNIMKEAFNNKQLLKAHGMKPINTATPGDEAASVFPHTTICHCKIRKERL
jgi:hypothetical protein